MGAIVGILGLAGSGKDTAANFLIDNHNFVRISFADPIKRVCRDIFDFSEEQLWGPSAKRNEPDPRYPRPDGSCLTPREALQKLGSEWGRTCYPNVWVEYAIRIANTILDSPRSFDYQKTLGIIPSDRSHNPVQGVVIPDCRFVNEVNAVKNAKGTMIRIVREGAGLSGNAALHDSELEQQSIPDSEFNYIVENNSSLKDLGSKINSICQEIL